MEETSVFVTSASLTGQRKIATTSLSGEHGILGQDLSSGFTEGKIKSRALTNDPKPRSNVTHDLRIFGLKGYCQSAQKNAG